MLSECIFRGCASLGCRNKFENWCQKNLIAKIRNKWKWRGDVGWEEDWSSEQLHLKTFRRKEDNSSCQDQNVGSNSDDTGNAELWSLGTLKNWEEFARCFLEKFCLWLPDIVTASQTVGCM